MAYPNYLNPIEREIIDIIVTEALAAGYTIAVDGGGDDLDCPDTMDREQITENIGICDETALLFRGPGEMVRFGYVSLVHGNGAEVICDYTTDPRTEAIVAKANIRAEELNQ